MQEDNYVDIDDLEAFIEGLKNSFDSLEGANPTSSKGFQAQLAKAISLLRVKKIDKIGMSSKFIGHPSSLSKEDLKSFLLNKLEFLKAQLDGMGHQRSRKFKLIMKMANLREQISRL